MGAALLVAYVSVYEAGEAAAARLLESLKISSQQIIAHRCALTHRRLNPDTMCTCMCMCAEFDTHGTNKCMGAVQRLLRRPAHALLAHAHMQGCPASGRPLLACAQSSC